MANPKRNGVSKVRSTKQGFSRQLKSEMPNEGEKKKATRFEHGAEFRVNIGARNPFVIAQRQLALLYKKAKKKDRNLDPSRYKPKDLRKMMKLAFKDFPYENMFDPKSGSPVYHGIYNATARLAESCPQRYASMLEHLQQDPARKTGVLPPHCKNIQKSTKTSSVIGNRNTQYIDTPIKNNGIEFDDPMQGCIADCFLISALVSVAWAETNGFLPTKLSRTTSINLYPPSIFPKPAKITTSLDFWTDTNVTMAYYAYTNPLMLPYYPNFYECWPSYYEKCFASYLQQNKTPPFSIIVSPSYDLLNYGSSFGATMDLTGKTMNINTEKYTKNYIVNGNGADNDSQIIEDIRINACGNIALADDTFIPTKKPSTAYTYITADLVDPLANQAKYKDKSGNISPVAYDDSCALPANHAYSILGLYQTAGKKYVVLRNPWGYWGEPAHFFPYVQEYLAAKLPALPNATYINNLAAEGIFGLQSPCFMRYFEAFGWTV
jgi:hypothetical protein